MSNSTPPMLSIQEKKPLPIQLTPIIALTTMDKELDELLKSRNRLIQSKSTSLESRLHQLHFYYDSLAKIKPRYTVALERSGLETIHFAWQDSFKPTKSYTHTSIDMEKVAVVFNIAAVYSQMAERENGSTSNGLKEACKAFQSAAGALGFLRERFEKGESTDVSKECVSTLEKLMQAQAQECFFHNAVQSMMSPSSCSRAARQVEKYYEEIHGALISTPLDRYLDKAWLMHVQLKTSLFCAQSCYHYASHLHNKEIIGEEIARLRMGIHGVIAARKSVKGAAFSYFVGEFSRLEKIMCLSLKKVEKENNSIYYARVPLPSALTDLPAFALKMPAQLESLTALEDSANSSNSL